MFYGVTRHEDLSLLRGSLENLASIFGSIYASDDLITVRRNVGFASEARLISSIEAAKAFIRDPVLRMQAESKMWRMHVLTWSARSALAVPGDFVECGVFDGFTASVVASYVDIETVDKMFYLYDTFTGLDERYASESELKRNAFFEQHSEVYDICQARFAGLGNVKIRKGTVPDILWESAPVTVSFLHLDMNCAQAELQALGFFFDRITSGGLIVLDDYGKQVFLPQKEVADAFLEARGHSVLELPTGQGLVLKH